MRAPSPQCGSHEPNAQPWAAMCCETENSYAWPRPLLDTRAGVDGIAGLEACQHCGEEFCKAPSPAANKKCENYARPCRDLLAAGCAGVRCHVLRRVLAAIAALCHWAAVAVGANLQLLLPMWFRQSFFWSNVAAPVWRPAKGPRPGRQRVTPHSISSGACLRIFLNIRSNESVLFMINYVDDESPCLRVYSSTRWSTRGSVAISSQRCSAPYATRISGACRPQLHRVLVLPAEPFARVCDASFMGGRGVCARRP